MNREPSNVFPFAKAAQAFAAGGQSAFDGGGEPPHNDGMEARVKALEDAVKNLPTKADFAELRADMHKNTVEVQRWMIATVIALFLGFSGLFFTMNNSTKPVAPATAQQPIIINVPAVVAGHEKGNGKAEPPPDKP
ncbi:hypothetical protein N5D77_25475 [Comamonas thiooxydans]|uniref:Transmembrane protein n=1 Tax=Comamonas thiooxydans TaxID=363952 RepID=A0AA42TWS8_9BURK|nr:hypothetical protein [Comamonas thiooxydans]MDH1337440.1 hypothetical protein [Comamonas thiooxydans]MDH1743543.1 hypothetical protein [Comamonas thiooxydans]MDH1789917.1 hypothetical protein [Comamonas thiooxydans]